MSDLGGQDILQHGNNPKTAVSRVRDWLRTESGKNEIPSGASIYARYEKFQTDLPHICEELRLDVSDLTFADFSYTIARWLQAHQG